MAWRGMITDAMLAITQKKVPVVFTSFEDTGKEIVAFLAEKGVPYRELNSTTLGEADRQEQTVFVAPASLLSSASLADFLKTLSGKGQVSFLFAGHYPLPAKENALLEKLYSLFPDNTVTFYSSLDDPSFELFNSDRIVSILESLGLKEDEMLEHKMITTAMKRAREKIEASVKNEILTSSEEEWFLKNTKRKSIR